MSDDNEFEEELPGAASNTNVTLVPSMLTEKVKRDKGDTSCVWYFLRLTPENNNYTWQDVELLVKNLSVDDVWFMSEELSKKAVKHYHIVFWHIAGVDPRDEIKQWLVAQFPGAWKKQDGNKRYNLQQCSDVEKCMTYTSKDGDHLNGTGINCEYIKYVNSKSFQKKDTRISQLLVAREQYLLGNFDDRYLFDTACDVYIATSSTGSLNMTFVRNFITGAKAERDPVYRTKLYQSLNL